MSPKKTKIVLFRHNDHLNTKDKRRIVTAVLLQYILANYTTKLTMKT